MGYLWVQGCGFGVDALTLGAVARLGFRMKMFRGDDF